MIFQMTEFVSAAQNQISLNETTKRKQTKDLTTKLRNWLIDRALLCFIQCVWVFINISMMKVNHWNNILAAERMLLACERATLIHHTHKSVFLWIYRILWMLYHLFEFPIQHLKWNMAHSIESKRNWQSQCERYACTPNTNRMKLFCLHFYQWVM